MFWYYCKKFILYRYYADDVDNIICIVTGLNATVPINLSRGQFGGTILSDKNNLTAIILRGVAFNCNTCLMEEQDLFYTMYM